MFLLFMGGFTAIMKQHNYFYIFDSHSRDEQSLSIVGRTSVILKFYDLREVKKYIQSFLSRIQSLKQSYFCNLQFVPINIDRALSSNILNHYQRFIRRPGYQEHFINKLFDGGFISNSTDSHRKKKEYNPPVETPKKLLKTRRKKGTTFPIILNKKENLLKKKFQEFD